MNKNLLRSKIVLHGETAKYLSSKLGLTEQGFSLKINGTNGNQFTQSEIQAIADRYSLTTTEICDIFFTGNRPNKSVAIS